jgi:rubrerythrin
MDKNGYSSQALLAISTNLAKACEKQHRLREQTLFKELASYFETQLESVSESSKNHLNSLIDTDLEQHYEELGSLATELEDRGTLRCVTWAKKVTTIQKSLLSRYEKQKEALLEGNSLYVCDACGFIAVSPNTPTLCPICKAPASRFVKF